VRRYLYIIVEGVVRRSMKENSGVNCADEVFLNTIVFTPVTRTQNQERTSQNYYLSNYMLAMYMEVSLHVCCNVSQSCLARRYPKTNSISNLISTI
jgi:hypothetical protein